ncbi:MAG: acetolactate synthase large subunit, partial [Acidimicrobiales bacterium]
WAESMGCVGIRVDDYDEVGDAIAQANEINDRPVVIDFRTEWTEKVFPMVPSGKTNTDVMVHPSQPHDEKGRAL